MSTLLMNPAYRGETQMLPLHTVEERVLARFADKLTRSIQQELVRLLQKQNRDGSWFMPTVIDSLSVKGTTNDSYYYHYVVFDWERMWHFDYKAMISPWVLSRLSNAVGFPVTGHVHVPNVNHQELPQLPALNIAARVPLKYGILYVVALREPTTVALPTDDVRLPKTAKLDLGTRGDMRGKLLVPFGESAKGPVWKSLPKLCEVGGVLVAGATGSGKSTFLGSAIAALTLENSPRELQIALIDPKGCQLMPWSNIPHRFGEKVAVNPEDIANLLEEIVAAMERRDKLFAQVSRFKIESYNQVATDAERLPYLLVAIDKVLDIVESAKGPVISCLRKITGRGRSTGVIAFAMTQRAAALDGLPSVILDNFETRLVFRVVNAMAAKLGGCPGAQNIPQTIPGRMFAKIRDGNPILLQGYALSEEDVVAIANTVSGQTTSSGSNDLFPDRDRLLLTWAMEQGGAYLSIGDIMRVEGVGQQEARRIARRFEDQGWLTKDSQNGNKRRVTGQAIARLGGAFALDADKPTNPTNPTNRFCANGASASNDERVPVVHRFRRNAL